VSEVALACVLLVAGGLLLRSLATVLDVDLGFRTQGTMSWRIESGRSFADREGRIAYHDRLTRLVGEIPGVESVGLTDTLPLGRNRSWDVRVKGEVYADGEQPGIYPRMVDAGYLQTMRIPLAAGRYFTPDDTPEREGAAVINTGMARRLWPDRDPLGQVLLLRQTEWRVVGVVADVRHSALEEEAGNEMYFPISQQRDFGSLDLVVRGQLPPEALASSVQAALREADPTLPVLDYQRLSDIVDRAVSPRRFILYLLGGFAVSAVLLVSLGIYGVLSYSVRQRTHEIGIRRALGESATQVQGRVVGRTLALATIGILLGGVGSTALSGLIASLLYGVSPTDPLAFAAMVALLLLISAMAGYVPARRASRIDPLVALRSV
jgi:predicted permease